MLSQLVSQAGILPIAVDCFGDQDTRGLSLECVTVPSLNLDDIMPAVEHLRRRYELKYLAYGSGFEFHVESLSWLHERFVIIGNPAPLFSSMQDKRLLFKQFSLLSIPYPETRFSAPAKRDGWLFKPPVGAGGYGIRWSSAVNEDNSAAGYWQRYQSGDPISVLFAAAGHGLKILGFNSQYAVSWQGQPFVFAGISNHAAVAAKIHSWVEEWLRRLIAVYPLRGLGSLDLIVDGCDVYVLEINARIPASAQLYGSGIFNMHIQSCQGYLPEFDQPHPSAYRIIFAGRDIYVPYDTDWPDWVVDRPESGAFIGEGQPVCSIIAAGNDVADLHDGLQRKLTSLEQLLQTGLFYHAIPGKC